MRIRYGTYSDFKTCKIPKVNNFDKLLKRYKRFITCIFNMFLMNKKMLVESHNGDMVVSGCLKNSASEKTEIHRS